jgi:hypothetical protein
VDWIKAKISSAVCGRLGRWRAYVCALRRVGHQRISLRSLSTLPHFLKAWYSRVRVAGGFEGGVDMDCVFFVEVGRRKVGASVEPPSEELSRGRGYFKVAIVSVKDRCTWVLGWMMRLTPAV